MTTTAKTSSSVSREEMIERARALTPVLAERSARTDAMRQVPPETVDDIVKGGFLRIGNPDAFGGVGLEYDVMFDVAIEMARGCGSTAWCYAIWTSHNWLAAHWPVEAQEEYFAEGPDVVCSTAVNAVEMSLKQVEGGYRLSGRWEFSSGCDAGTWVIVSANYGDGPMWVLVPRAEYEIIDTWFVSGLKGSGSKDIVINDVFVPAHRAIFLGRLGQEPYNAWNLYHRPSYRIPLFCMWGYTLAAPIIGMAQGMVDEFTRRLNGTSGPGRTAESGPVQLRIAEASAEVELAQIILRQNCEDLIAKAERQEEFSRMDVSRYQRDRGFMTKLSIQAINRLFDQSGGHSIFETNPLQRFHRDAHAASHRTGLILDFPGEAYGKAVLGVTEPGRA